MMTSDDKVGGWGKKGQNHDDVILECPLAYFPYWSLDTISQSLHIFKQKIIVTEVLMFLPHFLIFTAVF